MCGNKRETRPARICAVTILQSIACGLSLGFEEGIGQFVVVRYLAEEALGHQIAVATGWRVG